MKRVDQIKIPPHEPIAAIDAGKAALSNAGPGIKLAPRCEAILLKQFRSHATRPKGNPIVAVTLVQSPIVVKQSALFLHALVKRRARKRCEMIERRDVERVFLGER